MRKSYNQQSTSWLAGARRGSTFTEAHTPRTMGALASTHLAPAPGHLYILWLICAAAVPSYPNNPNRSTTTWREPASTPRSHRRECPLQSLKSDGAAATAHAAIDGRCWTCRAAQPNTSLHRLRPSRAAASPSAAVLSGVEILQFSPPSPLREVDAGIPVGEACSAMIGQSADSAPAAAPAADASAQAIADTTRASCPTEVTAPKMGRCKWHANDKDDGREEGSHRQGEREL